MLLDYSAGLLGQEDEVLADSASETDLLTDCSDGSGTDAENTAFGTADSTVETCSVSNLIVLLGCWGRKTRCLQILPLKLTS